MEFWLKNQENGSYGIFELSRYECNKPVCQISANFFPTHSSSVPWKFFTYAQILVTLLVFKFPL